MIIPFQTPPPPPIAYVHFHRQIFIVDFRFFRCRSPPSDRLQLAIDDTIVKPHRCINKTLGNISRMSFVRRIFLSLSIVLSSLLAY